MDQKGFTDLYWGEIKGADRLKFFMGKGARYLIINDPSLLEQEWMKPFLVKRMGTYKNVSIYDLKGF
jgi:hypothetical protein